MLSTYKMKIVALSSVCAVLLSSCANIKKNNNESSNNTNPDTESTYTTDESFTSNATTSTETSVSVETTEEKKFTYFGDEAIVKNGTSISENDWNGLYDYSGMTMLFGLGFDNPKLLETSREYFKNDTLTISDLNFLQVPDLVVGSYEGDLFKEINMGHVTDMDYIRYVLAENGLRLWVDQIPFAFFEMNFPDLVEKYNLCNIDDFYNIFNSKPQFFTLSDSFDRVGSDAYLPYLQDGSEESLELLRLRQFEALRIYNIVRKVLSDEKPGDEVYGQIDIVETTDGRNVYDVDDSAYRSLSNKTRELYHCENITIGEVETIDQLRESGVDVETYKQIYDSAIK